MTEFHKKLRHLSTTMLHWAEENKIPAKFQDYIILQRNGVDWKEDFKFVTKLDSMVARGGSLFISTMKMCNKLYRYYGSVYDTI